MSKLWTNNGRTKYKSVRRRRRHTTDSQSNYHIVLAELQNQDGLDEVCRERLNFLVQQHAEYVKFTCNSANEIRNKKALDEHAETLHRVMKTEAEVRKNLTNEMNRVLTKLKQYENNEQAEKSDSVDAVTPTRPQLLKKLDVLTEENAMLRSKFEKQEISNKSALDVQAAQAKIADMEAQKINIIQELSEKSLKLSQLETINQQSRQQLAQATEKQIKQDAEMAKLVEQLKEKEKLASDSDSASGKVSADLANAQNKISQLVGDKEQLSKEVFGKNVEIGKLESEVKRLAERVKAATAVEKDKVIKLEHLLQNEREKLSHINKLHLEDKQFKSELDRCKLKITELEEEKKQLSKEASANHDQIGKLQSEMKKLEKRVSSSTSAEKDEIAKLKKQLDSLTKSNVDAKKELDRFKTKLSEAEQDKKTQTKEALAKGDQIDKLHAEIKKLEKRAATAAHSDKEKINKLEKHLEAEREKISHLTKQNSEHKESKSEVGHFKSKITELEQEKKKLSHEASVQATRFEELQAKVKEQETLLASATALQSEKSKQLDEALKKLEEANARAENNKNVVSQESIEGTKVRKNMMMQQRGEKGGPMSKDKFLSTITRSQKPFSSSFISSSSTSLGRMAASMPGSHGGSPRLIASPLAGVGTGEDSSKTSRLPLGKVSAKLTALNEDNVEESQADDSFLALWNGTKKVSKSAASNEPEMEESAADSSFVSRWFGTKK